MMCPVQEHVTFLHSRKFLLASAWDCVLLSGLIHEMRGLYQSQVGSDVNLQGFQLKHLGFKECTFLGPDVPTTE